MRGSCVSCGKQGEVRPIRVDVTNRFRDNLKFTAALCGVCTVALTDSLYPGRRAKAPQVAFQIRMDVS